ncbi:hypothetical protein LJ737_13510 [Hymenobacter sp. 15J16-1T3B]|uniref:hypothetical protein n=1 Tax=Hymenobacter sp. 15J16-1T3B TaxID=2886941 RepID=UPI001D11B229|nr:hypothetical protein [Hymenobacter sp. 15J16-1T3B]MCC3158260.1 hypothetical protein [Hymenobacter sp. 15J16-1T3B]
MNEALITAIRRQMSPGGAFLSTVRTSYGEVEDRNCFVSGLVLRELAGLPTHPELDEARRLATAFLLRSAYPQIYPYCFAFWPPQYPPFWLRTALYADADDTCVIGLELVRAGHWPAEALEYIADNYLQPHRATGALRHHLRHEWQPEGVFLTWFTTADAPNPIDCCVNTNAVALLARAGLKAAPGYAEACTMINTAAHLLARHPQQVQHFTPYYPHPGEWLHALRHAVAAGADELQPALAAVAGLPQLAAATGPEIPAPLCSDVSGDIVWTAPVLGLARELRRRYFQSLS